VLAGPASGGLGWLAALSVGAPLLLALGRRRRA
jgi:hypothetical protein